MKQRIFDKYWLEKTNDYSIKKIAKDEASLNDFFITKKEGNKFHIEGPFDISNYERLKHEASGSWKVITCEDDVETAKQKAISRGYEIIDSREMSKEVRDESMQRTEEDLPKSVEEARRQFNPPQITVTTPTSRIVNPQTFEHPKK